MKKKKGSILSVRMHRFLRAHYSNILQYSYLIILLALLSWSMYSFYLWGSGTSLRKLTIEIVAMAICTLVAIINFFVAYSMAVLKEKEVKSLQNLVIVDELTTLYNKRYFLSKLHSEIVRARRYKHILAMIVIDIDHFKRCNDTYGHLCGDVILKNVATIIRDQIRVVDIACRFGGEEFAIICPETGIHEAKTIAERIRKCVEATKFTYAKKNVAITITAGINQFDPLKPRSNMTLFHGADQALYYGKKSGRNRVVLYSSHSKNSSSLEVQGADAEPRKRKRKPRKKKEPEQGKEGLF